MRVRRYYQAALLPHKHFLPFWPPGKGPEDILDALEWARANEAAAAAMADAAQAFAVRHLSVAARTCYWVQLLRAYAAATDFVPQLAGRAYAVPVADFLEKHMFHPGPGEGADEVQGQAATALSRGYHAMREVLRKWEP